MNYEIGKITKEIIEILKLDYLEDYIKYGTEIENIIKNPTYLARNDKKNSI